MLIMGAVAAIFIISLATAESIQVCDVVKLGGVQCTTCDFLTFGQENIGYGFTYFCPQDDSNLKYCCYGPTRKPFCCNGTLYIINGLVWVFAVAVIIGAILKLIKFLLF